MSLTPKLSTALMAATIAFGTGPTAVTPALAASDTVTVTDGPLPSVKVDESALRYFASRGEKRRLEAEIARLKALYPGWTPPENFDSAAAPPAGDPELDRLWELFGQGQFSEIRGAIAARSAVDPRWLPPQELTDKLEAAEAVRRLVNASDAGQWSVVLDTGTRFPGLLTCQNVDALWRVAEAFAKTARLDRARDAYRYVLTNCSDLGERLATLQKATVLLTEGDVRDLLRFERADSAGAGEFAAVRADLARRRVGRAAQDPVVGIEADELAEAERLARDGTGPDDAILVGFYHFTHGDAARSLDWFKRALDRNGEARAAEGYALALARLGRFAEAEAAAEPWRTASEANAKAYLTAVVGLLAQTPPLRIDAAILARAAGAIREARDTAGAQALGWYAYNIGQVQTAGGWFETALQWQENNEPAAFGLALVRQRQKDVAALETVVSQWRGRSERITDLFDLRKIASVGAVGSPGEAVSVASPATGVESSAAKAPAPGCRTPLSATQARELSPETALARGWCLLDLKRPLEAVAAFDAARKGGQGGTRSDAAYGRGLAYLAAGLTAEADAALAGGGLSPAKRKDLAGAIAAQKALASYRNGRYEAALASLDERARFLPERNDLLMLRGWSYFHLGRFDDAEAVFAMVGKTGTAEADQAQHGLIVIAQRLGRVRD